LLKLQEFNFDAIIGVNDVTSAGSMRYLLERGLKVPEDISLVCMEDSSLCSYSPKPITSFNVGLEEMGEMAAELMLKRLQHPQRKIASVAFSPTFAERATVIDRDS
jgi:LacI family transcriptional regulator